MSQTTEYESLRQEILEDKEREFNIITFSFTATAALIGFGFSTNPKEPLMFLTPLPILTMALIQLKNVLYSSLTKAVHIRIVIESGNPELNWEHCINTYRNILRSKKKKGHPLFEISPHMIVIIVIGILCSLTTFYFSDKQYQQIISLIFIISWISFSVYISRRIWYAISGKYERDLEDMWAEIWAKRESENTTTLPSPKKHAHQLP